MSPILSPLHKPSRLHLGPWRWSKCSAMKIKQSLGAGRGNCLYKTRLRSQNRDRSQGNTVVNVRSVVPIMIERHQEPEIPVSTAVLSEHKQCQLIFGRGKNQGKNYFFFEIFILESYACLIPAQKCSRLWCERKYKAYGDSKTHQVCVTKHMPWADNTPCSSDGTRVCHSGKCVSKYIPKPVIHGHWSGWTGWSACSFSCGRGVRKRKRLCNNPTPQNGGKFCLGPDSSYELCNTNPCNVIKDIRQEQCDVVSLPLRKSSRTCGTLVWYLV